VSEKQNLDSLCAKSQDMAVSILEKSQLKHQLRVYCKIESTECAEPTDIMNFTINHPQ